MSVLWPATMHATESRDENTREKRAGDKRTEREKKEVIFMSMTHNSLWP
jgi:hypothetical protein